GQRRRADLGSKAGGVACHDAGWRNGGGTRTDRQGERGRSDRGSRGRWRESRRESRRKGGRESWREGWRESPCGACCRSERGEEGRQGSKGHKGGEEEVAGATDCRSRQPWSGLRRNPSQCGLLGRGGRGGRGRNAVQAARRSPEGRGTLGRAGWTRRTTCWLLGAPASGRCWSRWSCRPCGRWSVGSAKA